MDKPPAVTVAGGDGTLFHLLCRLSPPWPPVVLAPRGRGNALARDIGAGRRTRVDAIRVLAMRPAGEPLQCWSLSSVGLGYPFTVTRRALPLRCLGRLSYAAAALFTLPQCREYELSLDGEPPRLVRLRGVLINNTRFAGGFEAVPAASPYDGLAECLELSAGYFSQLAHNLSVVSGLHWYAPVPVRTLRHARITPQRPMELMVDGELLGLVSEVDVEVAPAALDIRIACPGRL